MSDPQPTADQPLLQTPRFRVVRRRVTLPNGQPHAREVILHPGAVVILPVLDDGRVVLIRNHRVAAGETLWELPAGTREPDEAAEVTALRELQEETGYTARRLTWIREFFVSPGILSERMHLFLAEGLTAGPRALEPGEDIAVDPRPWHEALALADRGAIRDAKTLLALWDHDRRLRGLSAPGG